jgi:hypothetical protein
MTREEIYKLFKCVEEKDTDWRRFSSPRYVYENLNYQGGETVRVVSSAQKILNFLKLLKEKGVLNMVKEVELNYWVGNEFRGSGSEASYLLINKDFAEKIKLKGSFKWIDKGWGDYWSELEYEFEDNKQKEVENEKSKNIYRI